MNNNNNKPVPFNSPAGVALSLLRMIPAGTQVSVSLPVSVERSLNFSVGISENMQALQLKAEELKRRVIEYPQGYWFQQPEAED